MNMRNKCEDIKRVHLAQDRIQLWNSVNIIMTLGYIKAQNGLTS